MNEKDILAIDRAHIWHPYSAFDSDNPLYSVSSAKGVELFLSNGQTLIDGMSSWWSVIHGYNHPLLNDAIKQQVNAMSHVMFGGLTHEPAARLAKTLVKITPPDLDKVFFCDSGSVAVEIAMKMAIQYWSSLGQPQKHIFLTPKGGYHGDTLHPMSVCDPVTGMHHLFAQTLPRHVFVDSPQGGFDDSNPIELKSFEDNLKDHHETLAGVILEPIVQGAGGMNFYSPAYLKAVKRLCEKFNLLLIADEIATGFGRTGKLFACEYAQISPDILCLGKALTGGYMTLAATLCTNKVAQTVCAGEAGVFMHGPTFMANPLACSVANKSIELLLSSNWQEKIVEINQWLKRGLKKCENIPGIKDIRILGAIGVIEMEEPVDMKKIQPAFVNAGIWLRPFGKLVYTMPPFVISEQQCDQLTNAIYSVLKQYSASSDS